MGEIRKYLRAILASPRVGILAVFVAIVLNLPSIPTGWYLDDLLHRAQFLEVGPMTDSSDMTHRMFDFLSGDPEEIRTLKDLGVLPWWAEDRLKIRFWRPLSSLTHVLDYSLWPDSGTAMHLQSVLWLSLLVGSTALLYRRMIAAPVVAGLAALLFAFDDAHGMPVAFLANRNAIVAAGLGVLSLWSHDRFRRGGWVTGAVLSPVAFLAALLAGESGIGIAPYLLGYALFVERKSGAAPFVTIAPHAVIGVVWLAVYKLGGYGTFGSGFYTDPIGQPSEWLSQFPIRASLLLLGQWFVPPSSFAFAWTPAQTAGVAVFGIAFLVLLFFLLRPILREDPAARCFAFGMLLSVVPITAVFPHDRLLLFVGVGAMGLLAMLLARLFDRRSTSALGRVVAWVFVIAHVVIAAPLQLLMSGSIAAQEPIYANPPRSLPDDPELETQRLLLVNLPAAFYGQYTLVVRHFDSRPAPKSMLMLAPGITSLVIDRPSPRTLSIEAEDGWIGAPFDIVYRGRHNTIPEKYRVELSDVRIEVESLTRDGRPKKVSFVFDRELEDESLRWVRYQDSRYVAFEVPEVGESLVVEAVPFSLFWPPEAIPAEPGGFIGSSL